jgi:DNA-binding MarR family transcriptional regulator
MPKKKSEEKSLEELLADVSIRMRIFRATLQAQDQPEITGKALTEHEMLLVSLLGVLGGDSQNLNINDIHRLYQVVSLSALSNTIKTLRDKEHGYIERTFPSGDKRGFAIQLTEKGRLKYQEILKNNSLAFHNVVKGFDLAPEHEPIMRHYFAKLVDYFDERVLRDFAPIFDKDNG